MRLFAERWTSARRGVAKVMACVITTGLIALFAPGCGDGGPTPKPGEPGGGPKLEDEVKAKGKVVPTKPGDESIAEKRAKRAAAAGKDN